jgi:hypothetical protein
MFFLFDDGSHCVGRREGFRTLSFVRRSGGSGQAMIGKEKRLTRIGMKIKILWRMAAFLEVVAVARQRNAMVEHVPWPQ